MSNQSSGIPLIDQDDLATRTELEHRHWWFQGRDRVIDAALARLAPGPSGRVLDAGCGSGLRAQRLAAFGDVCAVDVNPAAVRAARQRGLSDVREATVEDLPFDDSSFDLVTCLDVIEHADDDRAALAELRRVSAPGGSLLLSVPAYPGLFSDHDVAAGHRRRYRLAELLALGVATGWRKRFATHFNAVLLGPAAVARLARRRARRGGPPRSDLLRTPPALDPLLVWPLRMEAGLVARGVSVPFGLSILVAFEAR